MKSAREFQRQTENRFREVTSIKPIMNEENNKLIASFMGFRIEYVDEIKADWVYLHPFQDNRRVSHLKFHTSWDWLMPVVEKIERLGRLVQIYQSECRIDAFKKVTATTKIEAVHQAVIEFINWYNQQTP